MKPTACVFTEVQGRKVCVANHIHNEPSVHLAHCYQGEFATTCKYGDVNCPAANSPIAAVTLRGMLVCAKCNDYHDEDSVCGVCHETALVIEHDKALELAKLWRKHADELNDKAREKFAKIGDDIQGLMAFHNVSEWEGMAIAYNFCAQELEKLCKG